MIPVAQWGAQRILPYGSVRPHLFPRTTVRVVAGPPVDLSAFEGQPLNSKVLREATEVIMKDITGLLAGIRGETPPAEPYHPAVERRKARQEARKSHEQAAAPADTGTADTGTADTGTADTGTADTGTADTGTADTGTAASGTAASDTGATPT